MTPEELKALQEKVGADAAAKIKAELKEYEATVRKLADEAVANKGGVTKETFEEYKAAADKAINSIKEIAVKQGTTLEEIAIKISGGEAGVKSIAECLADDHEELRKIYSAGNGQKTYMVTRNDKGLYVMKPVDLTKTVGPNASVTGINGGTAASISQALDAATLLRIGAGSMINDQYRNTTWLFDLCNTINASFALPFVLWFDEQAKDGTSATTAEGVAKPLVQYKYQLNSATYKKEAALVGFTEEFQLDFAQLQSDIMNKARIDVINRVNSAILPDIISKATAYNTGANFKNGTVVTNPNEFDAMAAMAAQVDNATFGARANTVIMSTFKKYRVGINKNTQGSYLNPPDVIANLAQIGNPAMGDDAAIVGDMKQYNIVLRGGMIVRVGFNGTDFAQNMFSVVLEQFYFNYMSAVRQVAIVKGPNFADVTAAISA